MSHLQICRNHHLSLPEARKLARSWAAKAQEKFGMHCTYEEGDLQDTLSFDRPGVKGSLQVDAQQFQMAAELGFLFSAFKDRIQAEIEAQLDALLITCGTHST